MNFIILGDKFQKRMKSKGCTGLIKLTKHKNIFQHQYETINDSLPEANIVYVCGFESKKFISFVEKNFKNTKNLHIIQNHHYSLYNYAYSLYLAKDFLNDSCYLCFGDNILETKFFTKIDVNDNESKIFINNKKKSKLGCVVENATIQNIFYDLDNYLSNVYYISKDHISNLLEIVSNPSYHNYFIFEIINKLIDRNQNIYPCYLNKRD